MGNPMDHGPGPIVDEIIDLLKTKGLSVDDMNDIAYEFEIRVSLMMAEDDFFK